MFIQGPCQFSHTPTFLAVFRLLLLLHLWLIQKQGMSIPPSEEDRHRRNSTVPASVPFFPGFLLREMMGWYIALGVLGALAALYPWELGVKADPFASAPPGISPEWYFLFMFQTLKYIPAEILSFEGEVIGILAFSLAGLLWVAVPFLDRSQQQGRGSRTFQWLGIGAVIFIVVMTIVSYVAD